MRASSFCIKVIEISVLLLFDFVKKKKRIDAEKNILSK